MNRRSMLKVCKNHGHAWLKAHPYSAARQMGRWRCYRCHRYGWLTEQQVRSGHRQSEMATLDREWPARRVEEAVTDHATPRRRPAKVHPAVSESSRSR